MFLLSSSIVYTLHVLCADDVLVLTFTEGVLVCTPGWSGIGHWYEWPWPSGWIWDHPSAWHKWTLPSGWNLNCFVLQWNSKERGKSTRYSWSVPRQVSNCIHNLLLILLDFSWAAFQIIWWAFRGRTLLQKSCSLSKMAAVWGPCSRARRIY